MIDATGWELEPTPWARQAACAGGEPDTWFPHQGGDLGPAKRVCASCPVRRECLEYALAWNIRHGVWGGLSPSQRRPMATTARRARKLPAHHGTSTRYATGCHCGQCREAKASAKRWLTR